MRKFDVNFRELGPDGKPAPLPPGLVCPACGCRHFRTIKTGGRPGGIILRRRECRHCGRRVTTRETVISAT